MLCPKCQGELVLKDSKFGKFYGCSNWPKCNGSHGAHPDGRPLGVPADDETKKLRMECHALFEKVRVGKKKELYKWLAHKMCIPPQECHFGMMDKIRCQLALGYLKSIDPSQKKNG